MGLKFVPASDTLRLLAVRRYDKKAEDGTIISTHHFVKFADEATFESNEFMLPKEIDPATLVPQTRYKVVLDIDGKWTRPSLIPADPAESDDPGSTQLKFKNRQQ